MSELKPCPFCGKDRAYVAEQDTDGDGLCVYINCDHCGASSSYSMVTDYDEGTDEYDAAEKEKAINSAIEAWNSRDQETRIQGLVEALEKLRVEHYQCEDSWYSCPKSEDGCANEFEGDGCNCGADKHNEIIDQALTAYKEGK